MYLGCVVVDLIVGQALKIIKNEYHIDAMGRIGDSYNDISMLDSVDYPFTFIDAPNILKDHAQYLVHSVSEGIDQLMKHV